MISNFQGQAVGGIVVALLNIVTIAVGSDSVHSASWSFLIGTLFTLSSLILYIIATRLPFYKVGTVYLQSKVVKGTKELEIFLWGCRSPRVCKPRKIFLFPNKH